MCVINAGCPGNYQYERQPPTNFTQCNPVTLWIELRLHCSVLVPHDSNTVTVQWYWRKNISDCIKCISNGQKKFEVVSTRAHSHLLNVDRITTDLTIKTPMTRTGYYWCEVIDPEYNGILISSNKAPVFDNGITNVCGGTYFEYLKSCAAAESKNFHTLNFSACFPSHQITCDKYSLTTTQNMIITNTYITQTSSMISSDHLSMPLTANMTYLLPSNKNLLLSNKKSLLPSHKSSPLPSDNSLINTLILVIAFTVVLIVLVCIVLCIIIGLIVNIKKRKTYRNNKSR